MGLFDSDDIDEVGNLKNFSSGEFTLIPPNKQYAEFDKFIQNAPTRSIRATLYREVNESGSPLNFESKLRQVTLNMGRLEGENAASKIEKRKAYAQHLTGSGIAVNPFSDPTSFNAIHIKAYEIPGLGFGSTGNVSGFESSKKQTNLAFKVTGNLAREFNEAAFNHKSTEHFSVGKNTQERLIASIDNAPNNSRVIISSPYLDSTPLLDALKRNKDKNLQIDFLTMRRGEHTKSTNNVSVDQLDGGSLAGREIAMAQFIALGGRVWVPKEGNNKLRHEKLSLVLGANYYKSQIASDNFTNSAFQERTLDWAFNLSDKKSAKWLESVADATISDFNNQGLEKFEGNSQIKSLVNQYKELQKYPHKIREEFGKTPILPSQLGPTYFYEQSLYNASRALASQPRFEYETSEGMAASAYKMRYMGLHGVSPDSVPDYVKRLDQQMMTPGLGAYINEWAATQGYGRLYKDEYGALPSIAGAIGAVFDKTLLFYMNPEEDWIKQMYPVDIDARQKDTPKGFFEAAFTFSSNFAIETTKSIMTYFAIGLPLGLIGANIFKSGLDKGLVQIFNDVATPPGSSIGKALSAVGKGFLTGTVLGPEYMGYNSEQLKDLILGKFDPAQNKRVGGWEDQGFVNSDGIVRDPITEKGFYENSSSAPGINTALYRRRGEILFNRVTKGIFLDVMNPYDETDIKGTQLINSVKKFGETLGARIDLKLQNNTLSLVNLGYERSRAVARAFDDMALHMPLNPMLWGIFGKTNPKNFYALGDLFSFTDLVDTFHNLTIGPNPGMNKVKSEVVRAPGYVAYTGNNPLKKIWSQLTDNAFNDGVATNFNFLKTLLNQGWSNFQEGVATSPHLFSASRGSYVDFKNARNNLVRTGGLEWNAELERQITSTSGSEIADFLIKMRNYDQLSNYGIAGATNHVQSLMTQTQNTALSSPNLEKALMTRGRIAYAFNRGAVGLAALTVFSVSVIFDNLAQSAKPSDLITQFQNNFSSDPSVTPVKMSASQFYRPVGMTKIFGKDVSNDALYQGAWYAADFVAALGIASVTMGKETEQYKLNDEQIKALKVEFVRNPGLLTKFAEDYKVAALPSSSSYVDDVLEKIKTEGTSVTVPKGKFLRNFNFALLGLVFAPKILSYGIASLGNVASITKQTNSLWEGLKTLVGIFPEQLNQNIILAQQLSSYRSGVLASLKRGERVGNASLVGAYMAGINSGSLNITGDYYKAQSFDANGNVRVVAMQAPTAILQTFFAWQHSYSNRPDDKGIDTFTVGFQGPPALGMNLVVASPISYNRNPKELWKRFIWNEDSNNVLTYLQSIGNLSAVAQTTLGATSLGLAGLNFATGGRLFKGPLENVNAASRWIDRAGDRLTYVAKGAWDVIAGTGLAQIDASKSILGVTGRNSPYLPASWPRRLGSGFGRAAIAVGATFAVVSYFDESEKKDKANIPAFAVGAATLGISLAAPPAWSVPIRKFAGMAGKAVGKGGGSFGLIAATFFAMNWLATESGFGITDGMSPLEDPKTDPAENARINRVRIQAVLMSTALSTAFFMGFGQIPILGGGSTETQLGRARNSSGLGNAASKFESLHAYDPRYQTLKELQEHTKLVHEYITDRAQYITDLGATPAEVQLKQHLNSIKAPAGPLLMRNNKGVEVTEKPNFHRDKLYSLFDEKGVLNSYGESVHAALASDDYKAWTKSSGRGVSHIKLAQGLLGLATLTLIMSQSMPVIGNIFNQGQGVNGFYDLLDGQNEFTQSIAHTFRLQTGIDVERNTKKDFEVIFRDVHIKNDGGWTDQKGRYLVKNKVLGDWRADKLLSNIISTFKIDPTQPFISTPTGGVSVRKGEDGIRMTPYFQLQSANQDVSSSLYELSAKFFFKNATSGRMGQLISEQLQIITSGQNNAGTLTSEQQEIFGGVIQRVSARLNPLTSNTRRKTSTIAKPNLQLVSGSSLLALSLAERLRQTQEFSYQPIESLNHRLIDPTNPSTQLAVKDLNTLRGNDPNNQLLIDSLNASVKKNLTRFLNSTLGKLTTYNVEPIFYKFDHATNTLLKKPSQANMGGDSEFLIDTSPAYQANNVEAPGLLAFFQAQIQGADAALSALPIYHIPIVKNGLVLGAGILGVSSLITAATLIASHTEAPAHERALNMLDDMWGGETQPFKLYNKNVLGVATEGYVIQNQTPQLFHNKGSLEFSFEAPDDLKAGPIINRINTAVQRIGGKGLKVIDPLTGAITYPSGYNQQLKEAIFSTIDDSLDTRNIYTKGEDFKLKVKSGVVGSLNTYVDKIVGELEEVLGTSNYTLLSLTGKDADELKLELKTTATAHLDAVLDNQIKRTIFEREDFLNRFKPDSASNLGKVLSGRIINELAPFFQVIQKNLGIFNMQDGNIVRAKNQFIEVLATDNNGVLEMPKVRKAPGAFSKTWHDLKVTAVGPGFKLRTGEVFKKAVKVSAHIFTGVAMANEALGIIGSTNQLARSYEDSTYSEEERNQLKEYAGTTLADSLMVGGLFWTGYRAFGLIGSLGFTPIGLAVVTGLALLGGLGYAFLQTDSGKIFYNEMGKAFAIGKSAVNRFLGEALSFDWLVNNPAGSFLKPYQSNLISAAGVFATGLTLLGVGLRKTEALIVAGLTATALQVIPYAKEITSYAFGAYNNFIASAGIPFLGNSTIESTVLMNLENTYNVPGSPFFTGTAKTAIKQLQDSLLMATADPTGQATKSLLADTQPTGIDPPTLSWKSGGGLRPRGMSNSLLELSLKARAQYFNQEVIGRQVWLQQIKDARNYGEIKAYTLKHISTIKKTGSTVSYINLTQACLKALNCGKTKTPPPTQVVTIHKKETLNKGLATNIQNMTAALGGKLAVLATVIKFDPATKTIKEEVASNNAMKHLSMGGVEIDITQLQGLGISFG